MKTNLNQLLGEKCAVFGVYDPGHEAARVAHPALWSLQHRGQESSGIAVSDGERIYIHKNMGLVAQVYTEENFTHLPGFLAIGHNRYSTSHGSTLEHAQPIVKENEEFVFAHNGNLPLTYHLEGFLKKHNRWLKGRNDSEMMADAIGLFLEKGASLEEAIAQAYPLFTGTFSAVFMNKNKLGAIRDTKGIRPLSIGKLNGGYVIASETCAFETIGASLIRDVFPGEMVIIDETGLTSYQLKRGEQKLDIFEFVYFARPDSTLKGERVNDVRFRLGIELAKEYPLKADVVIPVPDSAIPAAEGYAQESGISMRQGFAKNRYIHRTFIQPDQRLREKDVELKLNPLPDVLAGKEVIIIDDSIVRGTTAGILVNMVREAGARRVNFLVTSPPIRFPDFYGIDTPQQKKLIAAKKSIGEIQNFIGADGLFFLSYEGMIRATQLPEDVFNTSCFTGIYPIDIGDRLFETDRVNYP